jgi:hypothetical protein
MLDRGLAGLDRYFGRDFILGCFLPLLLAVAVSVWLAIVVSGHRSDIVASIEKMPAITQGLLFTVGFVVVAAIAYVLAALQFSLFRFYEGYWPSIWLLNALRERMVSHQRHRWERLQGQERFAADNGLVGESNSLQLIMAQHYPPPTQCAYFMPTKLGNILRAAEIYPLERYGIDSVVIWPRLQPLLPDGASASISTKQTALDAMLMLRTLAIIFGIAWPLALVSIGQLWPLAVLTLLAWPIASLAHRSALATAVSYSETLKATFDLYRMELIKHLGIEAPASAKDERKIWDDLDQFYLRNLPLPTYPHPQASGAEPSDGPPAG